MAGIVEKIREEAKKYFLDAKPTHDWSHVERVYNLCMHIGKKENADLEILGIAALLHDIGREQEDKTKGKLDHAIIGAEMAREILKKHNFKEDKINKIVHCIETHRFRNNKVPETKEAKVLFDADKLDAIGAIGIGRAFLFSGEVGARLHISDIDINNTKEYTKEDTAYREFLVKLSKIKDRMLTDEGKRIAEERHRFMVKFFNRLNEEVKGNL